MCAKKLGVDYTIVSGGCWGNGKRCTGKVSKIGVVGIFQSRRNVIGGRIADIGILDATQGGFGQFG